MSFLSAVPAGCDVVGAGRLGTAIARALAASGMEVGGPFGREKDLRELSHPIVLLCVPDRSVTDVGRYVRPGVLIGHCSGSLGAAAVAPREGFVLHPLMTVTPDGATFRGAAAAIGGTSPRALATAAELARRLGMDPIEIPDDKRTAYHAAASMASNYLVTLECAAEELAAGSGVERRHLAILARAALENWAAQGRSAMTGPIARGDDETVERQREAVSALSPEYLPLWDALAAATARLVAGGR